MNILLNKIKLYHFILAFFFLLYLLNPVLNSTVDSYSYAYNVKHGQELFSPHHLLYNAFNYLLYLPILKSGINIDALQFMKFVNALFATAALLMLYKTLIQNSQFGRYNILILVFFAGSCFGTMRFATEAETYIIPIFFSMIGSYFFAKFIFNNGATNLFWSGLFGSMACLFHQIHFFWWLGLLLALIFSHKNTKLIFMYSCSGILVILAYILVLVFYFKQSLTPYNLYSLIFYEYVHESLNTPVGLNNITLTIINFFRTFFQIHGKCIYLLKHFPLLYFSVIITIILIVNALLPFRKINLNQRYNAFYLGHAIALMLHLLFAAFAVGNSEFMVMLPFLMCCLLPTLSINYTRLLFVAMAMLLWNLSFSIVPDSSIDYNNDSALIEKLKVSKNSDFVLLNGLNLTYKYLYYNGEMPSNLIINSPDKIPQLDKQILDQLKSGNVVVTDIGNKKKIMSRSSMLELKIYEDYFKKFNLTEIDSIRTFYGTRKLFAVSLK